VRGYRITARGWMGRRAFAWMLAYVFVLHSVLAPIAVLAAAAKDTLGGTSFIEICSGRAPLATGADQINHVQHDTVCKHCMGCAPMAVLPPDEAPAHIAAVVATREIRWLALAQPDPDGPLLSGRGARGPPRTA
jgi:hypothetical protein